jgi:tetratricopeptide (TPR) repeat protein
VKKQSLITWALIVAVSGCTMPGIPGISNRSAQQSKQAAQMAKRSSAAKAPGSSWTERFTALLPGSKQSASAQAKTASPPDRRNDPISLDYPSGPPTSELFLSMAQLSDRSGKTEHARSMYRQALSIEPNKLDAMLGLARLEDREGRLDEALKIYQQAAAAHPQNAKVLNDLGLCYARSGQFTDSARVLDQAVRLQPKKALYRNNIAKVLTQVDRVDEAVAHLSAVHPPAVAQYNMGVLLRQRGKTVEAIHFLTAASHIDPQLRPAHAMLADLRGSVPESTASDGILPTPVTPSTYGQNIAVGPRYTAAPVISNRPQSQSFPAETAQVPQGNSPVSLPPVR